MHTRSRLALVAALSSLLGCAESLTKDVLNSGYKVLHDPKQQAGAAYLDARDRWREGVRELAREFAAGAASGLDAAQVEARTQQLTGHLIDAVRAQADDATAKFIDANRPRLLSLMSQATGMIVDAIDKVDVHLREQTAGLPASIEAVVIRMMENILLRLQQDAARWPAELETAAKRELPRLRPLTAGATSQVLDGFSDALDGRALERISVKVGEQVVPGLLAPLDRRWASAKESLYASMAGVLSILFVLALGAYAFLARRHGQLKKLFVVVGQSVNDFDSPALKEKITARAQKNYLHRQLTDYLKLHSL